MVDDDHDLKRAEDEQQTNFDYTVDGETGRGFVRIRVRGPVSPTEMKLLCRSVLESHPGQNRLWDYREADLTQLSAQDLSDIAADAEGGEPATQDQREALLVTRTIEFGISRMFGMLSECRRSVRFSVFRDEEAAELWVAGMYEPDSAAI